MMDLRNQLIESGTHLERQALESVAGLTRRSRRFYRPDRLHLPACHAEGDSGGQAGHGFPVVEARPSPTPSTPAARGFACGIHPEDRETGADTAADVRAAARDPEGSSESRDPHPD